MSPSCAKAAHYHRIQHRRETFNKAVALSTHNLDYALEIMALASSDLKDIKAAVK